MQLENSQIFMDSFESGVKGEHISIKQMDVTKSNPIQVAFNLVDDWTLCRVKNDRYL
jgi:hypothetical protein